MDKLHFMYLDRQDLENILPQLFKILYHNMYLISPTSNSYESDLQIWLSYIIPELQEIHHQIVLFYVDCELVGYFKYSINESKQSFFMEDIQIKPEFQGAGIFSCLLKWLVKKLSRSLLFVEAYADKNNCRSRAVLEHLGLQCVGENKNGISLYFKGEYRVIYDKFCLETSVIF